MAIHNRADSARHRHDILEDVPDVNGVSFEVDFAGRRQRPRPAAGVDVAPDRHDWRNLPELFKKLRRACITRMDDQL